jgi:predicted N-formylglutamate amidohydrolase
VDRIPNIFDSLLQDDEPQALQVVNAGGDAPILLTCDHASNRIPRSLDGLGLDSRYYDDHIAVDIGAADLTHALSERLNATALLAGYSRLAVDLNRWPGHPESIPVVSDGIPIPGNRALSERAVAARMDALFHPYQSKLDELILEKESQADNAAIVCVHSFTPRLKTAATAEQRPWHVGVLWGEDKRLSRHILTALYRAHDSGDDQTVVIGENQPYHGKNPMGYTLGHHAERHNRPYVVIEVRQDLIFTDAGVNLWAEKLSESIMNAMLSFHLDST